ncbi:MAG: sigma-70 family RNA polymerase sigma factor, partial [Oscillospiraceae bacterium]|nr:sigma-70 family RNA polymerase sigma factor [Oscillospiraceae bacterium]
MTSDEEKSLIKQVINGDKDAFEKLVLDNQKNVYNLALKITRNEEDALDLSQEAFIKAYRQLVTFRGDCKFSVWLYRLTYNLCIDFLRKKQVSKVQALSFEDDSGEFKPLEVPDLRNLPEESIIRSETRKAINTGINELTEKYREILIMR